MLILLFKRVKLCVFVTRIVVKYFTLHDILMTILVQKKKQFSSIIVLCHFKTKFCPVFLTCN
ncbi:hypothetical protein ABIC74_001886 [Mucilaginibacter rubeus]